MNMFSTALNISKHYQHQFKD